MTVIPIRAETVETRSTCPCCGVGCGVIIESTGEAITGVRGDPDHPANFGRLCTKGSTLQLTASPLVTQQTCLLQPMRRMNRQVHRNEKPQAVSWDIAMGFAVAGQMHPQDMARRPLKDGDLVHVISKRGSILVPLQASSEVGMSQAFMAMHWGEEYLSRASSTGQPLAGVNALTTSAYCPTSKQPELKHAAVKTNCGSCLPEVKRKVRALMPVELAA